MQAGFAFSKLADRLSSLADLSAQDLDLLGDMPSTIVHLGTHQTMVRHHSETDHCCLLLQGYLCWRVTTGQDAQITSIYVPGDVPDLHTLYHPSAGTNLVALGSAIIALVPHDFFHELSANSPAMSRALLLMMLTDLAIQRNWTVNLGAVMPSAAWHTFFVKSRSASGPWVSRETSASHHPSRSRTSPPRAASLRSMPIGRFRSCAGVPSCNGTEKT